MEPAKLQFSPQEMHLVSNAEWILTKNEILNKIASLMGSLNIIQKNIMAGQAHSFPAEIMATTAKISRGENYQGLPYLVLDYPRLFTRDHIFAIRSLFWWGRNLSTTLHISGKWRQVFADKILQHHQFLQQNNFLIATGEDEWVHDVAGQHYTLANHFTTTDLQQILESKSFFKLAVFAPVTEINHAVQVWEQQFKKIMQVISHH